MPAVLLAVVLLAINLRTVIASLPPLLEVVRADLGLSATVGGLLTTLPVVAFGALAPAAPWLGRRIALERILVGCALVTAAAAALRGLGGFVPLLLGMALAGCAVAVAQGTLPPLLRVRFPERVGLLTGTYAMALPLGATLAGALSVPLGDALGWRGGLAVWAFPALLGALIWLPRARRATVAAPHGGAGADHAPAEGGPRWSRTSWAIALFFGIQSAAFYGQLTWLPTILEDDGLAAGTAGLLQAMASLVSAPVALLVPVLVARPHLRVPVLAWIVGTAAAGALGLLLAPGVPLPWALLLGVGQGGALGLGLALPNLRGADEADVATLTAHSLLVGYLLGATGPWLLGGAHDLSGGWTVPLVLLLVVTLLELVPGSRAIGPRR